MEDLEVRILAPDGVISRDIYKQTSTVPGKGKVQVVDNDGNFLSIHRDRIVPKDAFKKAAVFETSGKAVAVCPECRFLSDVEPDITQLSIKDLREIRTKNDELVEVVPAMGDDYMLSRVAASSNIPIDDLVSAKLSKEGKQWLADLQGDNPEVSNGKFWCPDHGVFETFGDITITTFRKKASKPKSSKEKRKVTESSKTKKVAEKVDFDEVCKYGELWTRGQIPFDHATIDVQAHMLLYEVELGDEKLVRKHCFNTYDGTLGKKMGDPIQRLQLEDFKNNKRTEEGKPLVGYDLKDPIETVRTKLEKKGYERYKSK